MTSTLQNYVDLHRHAAVCAAMTGHPTVALRLMVAHVIVGSSLWRVRPDPHATRHESVRESVETCRAETVFDQQRRAALASPGFSPEQTTMTGGNGDGDDVAAIFLRLLDLPDPAVMEVIALAMGENPRGRERRRRGGR